MIEEIDVNNVYTTDESPELPNICQRVSAVQGALNKLAKDGENKFQHYKYVSESGITEALRPLCNKEGVLISFDVAGSERIPHETSNGKQTTITIISIIMTLTNVDDPNDFYSVRSYGEGMDAEDKGFYKAYTGAVKYALFKNFLVSSGEDVEPERPNIPTPPPAKPKQFFYVFDKIKDNKEELDRAHSKMMDYIQAKFVVYHAASDVYESKKKLTIFNSLEIGAVAAEERALDEMIGGHK